MKVSVVGKEVTSRDLAQRVISLELSDNPFDSRPTIVEAPDVEGPQIEIGNQGLIVVAPELEQGQLLVRLFGLRSSNNYEAVRMKPANGLIIKFGCLHSWTDRDVFQVSQLAFDRSGEPGDDDKASFALFQPLDDPAVVKSFVGADDHRSDFRRDFGEASFEQIQGTAGSMNISRAQLPMPEVFGSSLEAKQWMIRASSTLGGIVTDFCALLFSVDYKDGGIEVEDQARWQMGFGHHLGQEPVVEFAQPGQSLGCHAKQETSEGAGVGVSRQSAQVPKDTIVLQQLCCFDSFETKNDRVQDGKQQFPDGVAIVPLDKAYLCCNRILEPNAGQKTMKQIHPAIMGESSVSKRNNQFSRPLGHPGEPYLLGSFHRNQRKSSFVAQNGLERQSSFNF